MSGPMMLMVLVALVIQLTSWSPVTGVFISNVLMYVALCLNLSLASHDQVTNMLDNPSFEEEDLGAWTGNGQDELTRTDTDKLEGSYSLLSTGRTGQDSGPTHMLQGMQMGRGYRFIAYVKLLNDKPGMLWQQLKAVVSFNLSIADEKMRDPRPHDGSYIIAYRGFVTTRHLWVLLTGDINAPMMPFSSVRLSIQGPDPEVDFLLDNVTFYDVPETPPNWLTECNVMIDQNRKSDVTFRVFVPENVEPHSVDVQVQLRKHLFPFGCKFDDTASQGENSQKFMDLFVNLFNWATVANFSWNLDEGNNPDFSSAMAAVDSLIEKGIKVRAASIIEGMEENEPKQLMDASPEELPKLLKSRVEYLMKLTKGKVQIWDVVNEYLQGKWYEERLQDPNITEKVFKWAQAKDPKVKLAINDFLAINSGANTEDLHDLAKRFIVDGTGIQALGIQGHSKPYVKPDPYMIWQRLDRLVNTGLDLFLTEFDLGWNDDVTRADWFEDAMRAYFAHPAMSGVTLWGIWKEMQRYPNQYLIYGPDMKFAEQGERFVCLTQKEWTTQQTFNLAFDTTFTMRGFQGDYEVIIRKYQVPMQRETFTLGKDPLTVDIEVTEDSSSIQEHNKYDYVPKCISHRDRKSLGKVTSTSTDSAITCSNHMSEGSETVTCPEGMVMTSCNGFNNVSGSLQWVGETITMANGVATCTAVKGNNSPPGEAKVYARCCGGTGLGCDYRQAGPSGLFDGAMAESTCPADHTAMGCMASNPNSRLKSAFTSPDMTSCLALNGAPLSSDPALLFGAVSGAACCSKPSGLQCRHVNGTAKVTCPEGDVMIGCNAEAMDDSGAGSCIYDGSDGATYCKVEVEGPTKVQAVAVCCTP